jgi:RsiW-degrading membrane proteinase PrsW (M82 family)
MIRQISGVIIGYSIFVISSILLFKFSEVNPHEEASKLFMVWTFVYGTVFSFISGLLTQLISKTKNMKVNYVLFVIMVGFATFSLFKSSGSSWTQLLAIFIFAPVSVLGGIFWIKRF